MDASSDIKWGMWLRCFATCFMAHDVQDVSTATKSGLEEYINETFSESFRATKTAIHRKWAQQCARPVALNDEMQTFTNQK